MRPKPALAFLAMMAVVGFLWTFHSTDAQSQDAKQAPANGQDGRRVSSLEFGAPFNPSAQEEFEQQLTADERERLVELASRSALADDDCPLPASPRQPFYVKFRAPLGRELANRLIEAGASFLGYAYPHAHFVRARNVDALDSIGSILRASPEVAGTLLQKTMDACDPLVWRDLGNPDLESGPFRIRFWGDVAPIDAEKFLASNAIPVLDASRDDSAQIDLETPFVDVILTPARLHELVGHELVEWVERTPWLRVHNEESTALSHATPAELGSGTSYNLTGAGMVAGVWDAARARDTHVDLQGALTPSPINNGARRVLKVDGTSTNSHSGHVAGTVIGDGTGNSGATGYAPKGSVASYSWNSMESERRTARHNFRIVADNHSYGTGTPSTYDPAYYGGYDGGAQSSDTDIRDAFLNMCKSAGNDGSGDLTCTHDACMKNSFTIAATTESGGIASFSSRGPTLDGRMVPHFAANGVNLTSTYTSSDTAYGTISGTSMSSPSVCGSLVLLSELYQREMNRRQFAPDVARAILAATAIDQYNPGPDYRYGFGIVDCKRAADLILADKASGGAHVIRGSIRQSDVLEYNLTVTSSATPLKVVCSWLDIYASTGSANKLVNDLDLALIAPGGTVTHYPWRGLTSSAGGQTYQWTRTNENRRDNIELAQVDNPAVGTWKVRVTAFSIPANAQPTVLNDATGFVLVSEHAMSTSREVFEDSLNTGAPVAIPNGSTAGVSRTFSVTNTSAIKAVRVYIDVRHPRRGDIEIELRHPDTTSIILEDADTSTRPDIIAVYPDTRQYDEDVLPLVGKASNGVWTVVVRDLTNNTSSGNLAYLALEIDYDTANQPPVANAGANQSVNEGATVNLNGASSSDPENDPLTYQWVRLSGPTISITGANTVTPSFVAPQVTAQQTIVIQLTVDDGQGNQNTDTVDIIVNDVVVPNSPPVADAGSPFSVDEGDIANLNGGASTDPDSDPLTFAWTEVGTSLVTLQGANTATPSFVAPLVAATTAITFQLTVNDGRGGTDSDTVVVTVFDVPVNNPPVAAAGPDAFAAHGALVQLDGSLSSDPENDPLTYLWTQIGGANTVTLTNATTAIANFTAPTTDDVLEFQLEVNDGNGNTDAAIVTITVNATGTSGGTGGSGGGGKKGGGGGCSTDTPKSWLYLAGLCGLAGVFVLRRRQQA